MGMIAYQDPNHASYHGPKTVKCYGCGCKCAKSAWGNWCHPCNVKRLDQISGTLEGMIEKAKFDEAVPVREKDVASARHHFIFDVFKADSALHPSTMWRQR